MPQNLSPELLAYFKSLATPTRDNGQSYTRDGFTPVYDLQFPQGENDAGNVGGSGRLLNIIDTSPTNPNEHNAYDPETGAFSHSYTANKNEAALPLLFALAAGGMSMLPSTLGQGAAGSALTGGQSASSLLGGAGADTLGAASEAAGGSSLFNAAMDSQLANVGVADALAAYAPNATMPLLSNFETLLGNATGVGALGEAAAGAGAAANGGSALDALKTAAGPASSVFNAAKDSQLANEALGPDAINGYRTASTLADILSGLKNYAGPLGGLLGALGSGDKQTTASKEPWNAVQPWLKENIATGQALQKQYQDQPFNAIQQRGYQGLLDVNNSGMQSLPGLLGLANRLGTTNYQRSSGRDLAYSAPQTTAPQGVGFGMAPAPAIDWNALNLFRK